MVNGCGLASTLYTGVIVPNTAHPPRHRINTGYGKRPKRRSSTLQLCEVESEGVGAWQMRRREGRESTKQERQAMRNTVQYCTHCTQ